MSAVIRSQPVLPVSKEPMKAGLRWSIGILGLVSVIAVVMYVSEKASDPVRFPVKNVDVAGTLDYTDRDKLRELVEQQTQLGFYGMDVSDIRDSVETMPWVVKAHVRRVWPARLTVSVEEHEPAARYNEDALISKSLELFKPEQLSKDNAQYLEWRQSFANLPRLTGAAGRYEFLLDAYRNYEAALAPFGVSIKALVEDERRSQTLELSNDVTVRIGYESHELRLQRFIDVFERLVIPLNDQPAKFDMRYTNGFAMSKGGMIGGSN